MRSIRYWLFLTLEGPDSNLMHNVNDRLYHPLTFSIRVFRHSFEFTLQFSLKPQSEFRRSLLITSHSCVRLVSFVWFFYPNFFFLQATYPRRRQSTRPRIRTRSSVATRTTTSELCVLSMKAIPKREVFLSTLTHFWNLSQEQRLTWQPKLPN